MDCLNLDQVRRFVGGDDGACRLVRAAYVTPTPTTTHTEEERSFGSSRESAPIVVEEYGNTLYDLTDEELLMLDTIIAEEWARRSRYGQDGNGQ